MFPLLSGPISIFLRASGVVNDRNYIDTTQRQPGRPPGFFAECLTNRASRRDQDVWVAGRMRRGHHFVAPGQPGTPGILMLPMPHARQAHGLP